MSNFGKTGSSVDWVALQSEYESSPKQRGMMARLAKKYGCCRQAIYERKRRDNWREFDGTAIQKLANTVQETVKTNVIDIITKRAYDKIGGEAGIDAAADEVAESLAEELLATPRILRKLTEYAEAMIDRGMKNDLDLGDKAGEHDAFNSLLTGAAKLMSMVREAHGLTNGTPTIGDAQKSKRQRFFFVKPKILESPIGGDAKTA